MRTVHTGYVINNRTTLQHQCENWDSGIQKFSIAQGQPTPQGLGLHQHVTSLHALDQAVLPTADSD